MATARIRMVAGIGLSLNQVLGIRKSLLAL